MTKLIQGMYSDLKCKTFGISYGQNCLNDVIRNAGWFNHLGQKLGYGDLSLEDIDNISADIPDNELFIILSEADSTWNLPSYVNRFNPGIDYVMNNASWICSGFQATMFTTFAVKDHVMIDSVIHHDNASKIVNIKGIKYHEITKDKLHLSLGYTSGGFIEISQATEVCYKPNSYFGMDVYEYPDGKSWAVVDALNSCKAAYSKIKSEIYLTDIRCIRKYINFNTEDIEMLQHLIDTYRSGSTHFLHTLLGENLGAYAEDELLHRGCGDILAQYDGLEVPSDSIDGLPKNQFAYRIS